jgi:hypothetical protein
MPALEATPQQGGEEGPEGAARRPRPTGTRQDAADKNICARRADAMDGGACEQDASTPYFGGHRGGHVHTLAEAEFDAGHVVEGRRTSVPSGTRNGGGR